MLRDHDLAWMKVVLPEEDPLPNGTGSCCNMERSAIAAILSVKKNTPALRRLPQVRF